jgi:hypothetical protein
MEGFEYLVIYRKTIEKLLDKAGRHRCQDGRSHCQPSRRRAVGCTEFIQPFASVIQYFLIVDIMDQ